MRAATTKRTAVLTAAMIAAGLGLAMSLGSAQGVPDFAAIIAAPDRAAPDRDIDKRRDPVRLLTFTGVRTGMKVLDMGAGGGYSTELMARSVGPGGMVFKLVAEGDFLRQPGDPRDFNVNRPTGPVDELVLRFEKPR
jgi:predicted methyltransferase